MDLGHTLNLAAWQRIAETHRNIDGEGLWFLPSGQDIDTAAVASRPAILTGFLEHILAKVSVTLIVTGHEETV